MYSTGELLMISLLGLMIVFVVLITLSILTTLMGKVIQQMEGGKKAAAKVAPAAAAPVVSQPEDLTGELLAVLQCVLSEESGISPDEMIITSIEEVNG